MKDLQAIKTAALEYRHADRDDEEWPVIESNFHILAADPERIVGLIEQMEAFGKLLRDMSGYIKLAGRDKPDPVRDDLLAQARQLLEDAGL
jgi:hypothetical protein